MLQAALRAIDGFPVFFCGALNRTVTSKGQNGREEGVYEVNHLSSRAHCIAPTVVW